MASNHSAVQTRNSGLLQALGPLIAYAEWMQQGEPRRRSGRSMQISQVPEQDIRDRVPGTRPANRYARTAGNPAHRIGGTLKWLCAPQRLVPQSLNWTGFSARARIGLMDDLRFGTRQHMAPLQIAAP